MSVFKSYFITMKNVVFGSSGAHTLLRNQISINEAWNTTRNNTVLAKDQQQQQQQRLIPLGGVGYMDQLPP